MGISLGANQYGKAENRVVRVYRDTSRHETAGFAYFASPPSARHDLE